MPANSPPANANPRPKSRVTRFPGSSIFCRQHGCTHSHLYRVLLGERKSASLLRDYAAWLDEHQVPWPTEAKASRPEIAPVTA
ncbi:MAG: hypothetical protein V4662_11845 [Verrucomicrobiota bacterium]